MAKYMNKVIQTHKVIINDKEVTVNVMAPKPRKEKKYAVRSTSTCPYCKSKLILNDLGAWECTGEKLKIWENDFYKYKRAKEKGKEEILARFSNTSRFLELYDRWAYDIIEKGEPTYDCGYTNEIYPLMAECQEKIPDPLVVKKIEQKLGRKMTERELLGEQDLYWYGGQVLTEWRKKAKLVKVPWIVLPSEAGTSI